MTHAKHFFMAALVVVFTGASAQAGLVAWYNFDNDDGADSSGNSLTMTVNDGNADGSLKFETDVPTAIGSGKSVHFNSNGADSDDFMDITNTTIDGAFNSLNFTVSLWYKVDALIANSSRLFEKNKGAGDFVFNTQGAGGNNRFRFKAQGDIAGQAFGPDIRNTTPDDPGPATWHHLVAVMDPTNLEFRTFLDGSEVGSAKDISGVVTGAPQTGDGALTLARVSNTYDFLMDDFALFNHMLTDQDIADLADGTKSPGDFIIGNADPCDFEPDGDCDIDDVDLLVTQGDLTAPGLAVPPADAKFDLDGDNDVDTDDYDKWLTDAATVNGHGSAYRPADSDLDRDVDITDFNALASNFDPGGVNAASNGQSKGNSDADNDVDITDFNLLASTFSPGGYDGAAAAVADADPGQVDLVVDVETGEVTLDGNNAAISGLQVFSAGNSLLATDFTADVLQFVISTNTSTYAEGAFANMGVDGLISLGMMYDALVDARDVTFEYTMIGQPTVQGRVLYIPEPASLALMGMGVLLVLRRRRVA